ncbi:MAG: hypothetical protein KF696_07040 [Planctomycetes bacterium]|nr:hypothetical protein [Planctomycetota bacterium]MCW8135311.1 hypothetical protein [Planctomycetota bacterium]
MTTRILSFLLLAFATWLLASCGAGGAPPGGGSSGPAPVVVTVSPVSVYVQVGTQRQFTATVQGGGGTSGVTWSVPAGAGYGTIDQNGLYTAPLALPVPSTVDVRATSQVDPTKFATASVQLVAGTVWGQLPVAFQVRTRGNWQSNVAPVTAGIPLPRGVHSDVNQLRVQQQGGANVPAQFEVLSRWGDGSIRWVLCDFMADLSAGTGIGNYQLNNGGSGTAPAGNLNVVNGANDITVSTGLLNFRVSKTGFRLFESIQIDRDNNGQVNDECLDTAALKGAVVVDGATEYTMNRTAPTRIEVEQTGPIRATVLVEGRHQDAGSNTILDYVCRITAWANLPFVRVQYSFKNMAGHGVAAGTVGAAQAQVAAYATADALNVDLPFDFGATNPFALFGGSAGAHTITAMSGVEYAELYQDYTGAHDASDANNPQPAGSADGSSDPLSNAWATQNDSQITYAFSGKITDTGDHSPGWVQMVGSDLRVTAVLRDFWQMYPKCIRVQANGLLRMGVWPDAAASDLQVFAGAMRTHELLYSLERAGSSSVPIATGRYNLLNDPPLGVCNPRHYRASQVFGDIGVTDELLSDVSQYVATAQGHVSAYLTEVIDHMGDILFDRTDGNGTATGHEYGMWHYGDGKTFAPADMWSNNDWEISRACISWFAASGNVNLWRLGDETARHFRDVVVMHSDIGTRFDYTEGGNPAVSGGKASNLGKTRNAPNNKQHDLGHYNGGANHLDVFKGAFLAEHYLLTGDRLSLDVLKECFTYLRGCWKRHFDAGNGGVDSTMTAPTTWLSNGLHIAAAYVMANGLNDSAAAPMATYVFNTVRTRQTTPTPYDPAGRGFADSSGNFRAWELGHMAEALEYSQFALDNNNIQIYILDLMNWLLGTNAQVYLGHLVPPQYGEFAESPGGMTDFGGPNLMIGAGYVGAWRESGSANWRSIAANLLSAQNPKIDAGTIGDDGIRHRTFAQFFRGGPMLLGALMN